MLRAQPEFLMALSYNPGYQSVLKDLKQSTRQRFVGLEFSYPDVEIEVEIVMHESGVPEDTARILVSLAGKTRNLKDRGLTEGASTRLLIHAGKLICAGIDAKRACDTAVAQPLTDDHEMLESLREIISSLF